MFLCFSSLNKMSPRFDFNFSKSKFMLSFKATLFFYKKLFFIFKTLISLFKRGKKTDAFKFYKAYIGLLLFSLSFVLQTAPKAPLSTNSKGSSKSALLYSIALLLWIQIRFNLNIKFFKNKIQVKINKEALKNYFFYLIDAIFLKLDL